MTPQGSGPHRAAPFGRGLGSWLLARAESALWPVAVARSSGCGSACCARARGDGPPGAGFFYSY
eukprot:scaffold5240_cov116-Isochrysis_galbana.AAC.3